MKDPAREAQKQHTVMGPEGINTRNLLIHLTARLPDGPPPFGREILSIHHLYHSSSKQSVRSFISLILRSLLGPLDSLDPPSKVVRRHLEYGLFMAAISCAMVAHSVSREIA